MINFGNEPIEGFLSEDAGFHDLKNPFYPTLKEWMQLDSNQTINVTHEPESINVKEPMNFNSSFIDSEIKKEVIEKFYIQEALSELISSKRNILKCELKNRRDVVNKSILRAIKKQITQEFKSFHSNQRIKSLYRKIKYFKTSLVNMAETFTNLFDKSELYVLFGFLVNFDFFSQIQKEENSIFTDIKRFCEIFSNCCVQYSHTKFEFIVASPYFKILYSMFKSKRLDLFLSEHESIASNKESYKSAIDAIESKIQINNA